MAMKRKPGPWGRSESIEYNEAQSLLGKIGANEGRIHKLKRSIKRCRRILTAQERAARKQRLCVTLDRSVIKPTGTVVPTLHAALRKG